MHLLVVRSGLTLLCRVPTASSNLSATADRFFLIFCDLVLLVLPDNRNKAPSAISGQSGVLLIAKS
jgi:hypothetical protein